MPGTQTKKDVVFPGLHTKNQDGSSLQIIPKTELEQFIQKFEIPAKGRLFLLRDASNLAGNLLNDNEHRGILCYRKINNVRYLNKFFEEVNRALQPGGLYIGCVETNYQLRKRAAQKYPAFLRIPFFTVHFLVRRVLPKWSISKRFYFFITRGKSRVISLSEVLGRLVSCGFEILEYREIAGLTYYAVRKTRRPAFDMYPTYGPLVGLKRVGKDGKLLTVYKFRTMHPYSEYLQDYIYRMNNLKEGGKFDDDMRVTGWGKVMRKLWLDEQPMWWNLIKGDLKLVGVRPLSQHYFSLYPPDLQKLRTRFKPGLIPPFYFDLPKTFEEILESERRYLLAYEKAPFSTDLRYLYRALYNIFIKRARSG